MEEDCKYLACGLLLSMENKLKSNQDHNPDFGEKSVLRLHNFSSEFRATLSRNLYALNSQIFLWRMSFASK